MTPQQNINMWFLIYAGQLAADGQYQILLDLGFKREQIGILQNLSLTDVAGMAGSVNGAVIHAKVDPKAVDILFRIGDRRKLERKVEMQFIQAGASQRLMRELFGINIHQYTQDRDLLGIKGTDCGRRANVDEDTANKVWVLWHGDGANVRWQDADESTLGDARKYMEIHRATGLSLRDIENILRNEAIQHNQGHGGTNKEKYTPEKHGNPRRHRKEAHARS